MSTGDIDQHCDEHTKTPACAAGIVRRIEVHVRKHVAANWVWGYASPMLRCMGGIAPEVKQATWWFARFCLPPVPGVRNNTATRSGRI